jgi:5-methylcytosine-specific restriction endonuclease McrA
MLTEAPHGMFDLSHAGSAARAAPDRGGVMPTSRTGTTEYLRNSRVVKRRSRNAGILLCPECKVELDYEVHGQPNSAETDHIVPHALGGDDSVGNLRVICRTCNRLKSDGSGGRAAFLEQDAFPVSSAW